MEDHVVSIFTLTPYICGVVINGETIVRRKEIATGFPDETPSCAISPAEFERIDIIDGSAYLTVSVATNSEIAVKGEGWGKANIKTAQTEDDGSVTLAVPAPADQGFMILRSK